MVGGVAVGIGGLLGADQAPRFHDYVIREHRSAYRYSEDPQVRMILPASRLQPIEAPPNLPVLEVNVLSNAPPPSEAKPTEVKPTDAMPEAPAAPVRKAHLWTPALDLLRSAPRDLKMLAFAIPVLLGLALHPSLPKVPAAASGSTGEIGRNVERALNNQFLNVKQTMTDRAAVTLDYVATSKLMLPNPFMKIPGFFPGINFPTALSAQDQQLYE